MGRLHDRGQGRRRVPRRRGPSSPPRSRRRSQIQPSGDHIVTDGPFAETKEQLGGFYLLECENLDEAIDLGQEDPACRAARSRCGPSWTTRRADRPSTRSGGGGAGRRSGRGRRPPVPEESGRAVAALIRVLGDFDLAEEAVQDAFARRARASGRAVACPRNPGGVDHDAPRGTRRSTASAGRAGSTEQGARSSRRWRRRDEEDDDGRWTAPSRTTGCG